MLQTYFERARRLLKPGGLFLNQGTTVQIEKGRKNYPSFIKQYVFPDGEVLPIEVSIAASEKAGFEVLSNLSIREHYVKTCDAWVKNLEDNYEKPPAQSSAIRPGASGIYTPRFRATASAPVAATATKR